MKLLRWSSAAHPSTSCPSLLHWKLRPVHRSARATVADLGISPVTGPATAGAARAPHTCCRRATWFAVAQASGRPVLPRQASRRAAYRRLLNASPRLAADLAGDPTRLDGDHGAEARSEMYRRVSARDAGLGV